MQKSWSDLVFSNRFYSLGADFFTPTIPQGLIEPYFVRTNLTLATQLGLDPCMFTHADCLPVCSGNRLLDGMQPLAQAYAGHQLGKFNPFLGDGRSILLGGIETVDGYLEWQLKGAGKTAYARHADGLVGLSEGLQEYEISEQLAAWGIPTVRCLALTAGSRQVYRQGFQAAAILTRLAPSFIRFGHFELYYFERKYSELQQLTDFVIQQYYPDCLASTQAYAAFFQAVVERTAKLIAQWQNVGFVHGMMNTDNQSILGLTLDLGESCFNPERKPDCVSSAADEQGRYAFAEQPMIGLWNCNILARALSPLIEAKALKVALQRYEPTYLAALRSPT
ncbi:Uncharacterized ACR, YdiU/UPF0061 family [Thiothrix eikelboomii]|uniref:Uncharacterized ACR, YdiU/UPF0061 family n=1 Tax=Thiothrix eikelboomii TaxID=92487 RepID=A0A1T4XQ57_9GAMM|nr:protein adenylyltransferase SelO family protein [Thiothrix eikelboomii]SKA91682.1 Uncharacterized ACR, YdiU/UPF0061 family [Thiothrix eikelboomii]